MSVVRKKKFGQVLFLEPKPKGEHIYSLVGGMPRFGSVTLASLVLAEGLAEKVVVVVEDMLPPSLGKRDILRLMAESDLVCISATTSTSISAYCWADWAYHVFGKNTVIGGTHTTYFPEEALAHCSMVLRGEADLSFLVLCRSILEGGVSLKDIPGLSWRFCEKIFHNPDADRPTSDDLSRQPTPDLDLILGAKLNGGIIPIPGQRGCPFGCEFCSVTEFSGTKLRAPKVEWTLEVIESYWGKYQPQFLFFVDDIFNIPRTRALTIVEGLIKKNIKPRYGFGAQCRMEVAHDRELLSMMSRAGFSRLMIGFESVEQASLDACQKRGKADKLEFTVRRLHDYNLKIHGMFVLGLDGDNPWTAEKTLNKVVDYDLDSFQFMVRGPLPGARDWGKFPLLTSDWNLFDGHHAVTPFLGLTPYEANEGAIRAMEKFYSLPRAFGRLAVGDWVEALIRIKARKSLKNWRSDQVNINHFDFLLSLE